MKANSGYSCIGVAYYIDIVGVMIASYSGCACNQRGLASLAAHRRGTRYFREGVTI